MASTNDNKPAEKAAKIIDPANDFLSKETAEVVEVVNWVGGHRQDFGRFGIVDLKTLKPGVAQRLVRQGFSKLRLVKK